MAASAATGPITGVSPSYGTPGECSVVALETGILGFQDLSVTPKNGAAALLHPTSGELESGGLCAIMGASGSGKTTLLGALSMTSHHSVQGTLLWNGSVVNMGWMRRHTMCVPTHDTLFGQLTVLQNLAFYARIFGKTAKDVDHVVHELQIQNCAHRCLETLSTGQQKRVSLAVAILRECRVLFLDEPTSGLSDSDALVLMHTLQHLTRQGLLIVCVLHAPRYDIFHMMARLILVSQGRVVCNGSLEDVSKAFQEKGYPCPNEFVLATHVMDVVCCIHPATKALDPIEVAVQLQSHWQTHYSRPLSAIQTEAPLPHNFRPAAILTTMVEVARRDALLAFQNRTHYFMHWALLLSVVLILGLVYGKTNPHGDHFKLRAEMLYYFSPVNVFFIVAFKTYEVAMLKTIFRKEYHYRIVSPLAVHVASGWMDVLYFWFAAVSTTVCLRSLIDLSMDPASVLYHSLFAFFAIRFTTWIRWIIALFIERQDIAMFAACFGELVMEGFNGVFVGPDDIVPPLEWGCYLNPMYYVYQGVLFNENEEYGLPFEGWGLPSLVCLLLGVLAAMNALAILGLYLNDAYMI